MFRLYQRWTGGSRPIVQVPVPALESCPIIKTQSFCVRAVVNRDEEKTLQCDLCCLGCIASFLDESALFLAACMPTDFCSDDVGSTPQESLLRV